VSLRKSKIGFLNWKESEKSILRFFTKQINPRSPGSWCVKETEKSTLGVDSSVPQIKESIIAMLRAFYRSVVAFLN